ncbi:unnamed protein product [Heligmosomoides polygyrus]|uniref:SGS domain-containing protein n=1 Tax=Heligmosomoides polygyrus TaxID=6339 RepID=A0A183GVN0_HELPZ|nr:unnamed protein product [Heligmosomoides polygyrus]
MCLIVLKTGDVIGEWKKEEWIKTNYVEPDRDMMDLGNAKEWASHSERRATLASRLQRNDNLPQDLSLVQILYDYDDVFATADKELSQTNLVGHEIDTGDSKPIK